MRCYSDWLSFLYVYFFHVSIIFPIEWLQAKLTLNAQHQTAVCRALPNSSSGMAVKEWDEAFLLLHGRQQVNCVINSIHQYWHSNTPSEEWRNQNIKVHISSEQDTNPRILSGLNFRSINLRQLSFTSKLMSLICHYTKIQKAHLVFFLFFFLNEFKY